MENASKALVIAGAILISILLITIGIFLINSGRDVANSGKNAMSSSAIQAFNSQFTQYEGTGKSYSEVKQLLDTIVSSNASHANQVAVKLRGYDIYPMDSARFALTGKNSGRNIVPLNTIISTINSHPNRLYDVTLRYVDKYWAEEVSNNSHLNPINRLYNGCGYLYEWIDNRFKYTKKTIFYHCLF